MKQESLTQHLVDLYAGNELSLELMEELEFDALQNAALAADMQSLRSVVHALQALPTPEFSEESNQRIRMKLFAGGMGADPSRSRASEPAFLQHYLPISG